MSRSNSKRMDVIVAGAGPAGCAAAIKLRQLGYQVALVEARPQPAFNPGELLTPGVRPLLGELECRHLLHHDTFLNNTTAAVLWEDSRADTHQTAGHLAVDRIILDRGLQEHALALGVQMVCPSRFQSLEQDERQVRVTLQTADGPQLFTGRYLIDARGHRPDMRALGPPTTALWTELPLKTYRADSFIEACSNGWIWASRVTRKRFRIMVVTDAEIVKSSGARNAARATMRQSQFFREFPYDEMEWQGCDATAAAAEKRWDGLVIRVGDAAFRQDPISSSGVEKALRSAVLAAKAIHTTLSRGQEPMARSFYENYIRGTVDAHVAWTTRYYRRAWCRDHWFFRQWEDFIPDDYYSVPVSAVPADMMMPAPAKEALPNTKFSDTLYLSPMIRLENTVCVTGDLLEERKAVVHPGFHEPVAFIGGHDLVSLLSSVKGPLTASTLLNRWAVVMPQADPKRILLQLISRGVILSMT